MTARSKFKVEVIHEYTSNKSIELSAVTTESEENISFSKWIPSGNIQITMDKKTMAAKLFEVGKEYYVDFTAAESEE